MAEPYQPVPTATPEAAPARKLRIDANSEMFGAGVGNALQSVGAALEHGGNELFSTSMKFTQLDIENEVNKATTDYFTQSGELDNKYRLLEGNDPQKNLDQHVKALTDTRESIRGSLSSDFARKMFDRETMRRLGYDVVNAGGYAAMQAKQFNKQTRQANIDATIDTLVRDPHNDQAISEGLKKIGDLTGQESAESGIDSPSVLRSKVELQLGRAVDAVAKSLAKTDPDAAIAFTKKYEGFVHSAQFQETMDKVQDRAIKVRADREAIRIATPLDPILDRAAAVTKQQESGGDYGNVTTTKRADGTSQSALGAYGIMDRNLPEWSKQVLGREVSKEEFLKSPEIQDQIYRAKMGEYIRKYGVEGAGRAWLGGEGSVNLPDRKDALGTKVGDYGKVFATGVGSTVRSQDINEKSVIQMMQDAETSGNLIYPDDEVRRGQYVEQLKRNILTNVSLQKKELGDHITSLNNAITATLSTKGANGRGPTSFMEAGAADRNFADHYEELYRLDPRIEKRVQSAFQANAKADIPATPERERNYIRTVGMPDNKLMEIDPNEMFVRGEITQGDANKIFTRQQNIKRKALSTVMADQALNQNQVKLNDAHIFKSRDDSAANDRYEHLRGAVLLRMEEYAAEHQAQMPQKERNEMIDELLKEVVTTHHTYWFNTYGRQYEIESRPTVDVKNQQEYDDLEIGQHYTMNGQGPYRKRAQ